MLIKVSDKFLSINSEIIMMLKVSKAILISLKVLEVKAWLTRREFADDKCLKLMNLRVALRVSTRQLNLMLVFERW